MNANTDLRIDDESVATGDSPHFDAPADYWIERLRGAEPLVLSIKPRRTCADAADFLRIELPLQPEVLQYVRRLATSTQTSAFAVGVAAFKVLLMRWSGQDDVVVGASLHAPKASKSGSSAGASAVRLITLPLRTDLSGNPGFSELVSRIHRGLADARRHGDTAFDAFAAPPDAGQAIRGNPLFVASVHEASDGRPRGLVDAASAIELHIGPAAAGSRCIIQGRTDLYDEDSLHALAEQYVHMLRQGAERPDAPVSEHCLAAASPQRQLPDPSAQLRQVALPDVATQFREQMRRTPDAAAVQFGTRIWTYREFDARCCALAIRLQIAGARTGTVVALQGIRGPALVAAMTATTMCGGMFVVLDPALPKARRERMLGDAGATVLCQVAAESDFAIDLALDPACALLRIDPDLADIATLNGPSGTFEPVRAQPDDPICVVFTSGSTGKPKPVLASHKGLAHLVQWHATKFAVAAPDKVSLLSSLSFGTLLRDVYLPLTTGATLCIPEEADLLDPLAWCGRRGVTIVHTTPTVLDSWLHVCGDKAPPIAIRWVCVAGEPLTDVVVRAWRNRFPSNPGFVNLYGLTESSLAKCFYIVPEQVEPGLQPVGLSLPGTQALVFGPTGVPCGIGERGEIAIRTPYLSLGYLGLDDETRRKFRPNPQRNDPGDLLYFTGDVGHYRADGMLELAGRLDDQVKIRGVRIEPAEVAAALADLTGVAQCVVLARRDRIDSQAALIAYVVAEPAARLTAGAMRQHLSARLPAAMLPSAFVVMGRLPRLPNGKLDRAALPLPAAASSETVERVAPSTSLEETVWALWSEALNLRDFGVRDNFFDLGGHSLLAMQVISRLCEKLGVDLTMRTIFDAPTVAELAELAQSKTLRAVPGSQMPIAQLSSRARAGMLPLSAAQQRMYFWHEFAPGSALYNVPVVLRLRGRVESALLEDCLRALMQRHDVLRSRWVLSDDAAMQRFDAGTQWCLQRVVLTDDAGEAALQRYEELASAEALRGLDLFHECAMRATLVTLAGDEHRLIWTLHHSVCDGWAVEILLRELLALYDAGARGRSAELAPLALQYTDFAVWEPQWLASGVRERELAYWAHNLADVPHSIDLPLDRSRRAVQRFRGATVPVRVEGQRLSALSALVRKTGTTQFMALMGAWQALLYRYSGQSTIVTGAVVANRERRDLEGVVGYFANTVALRSDIDESTTVGELLAQVKAAALGAYEHQHIPFEEVVDVLKLPRDASRMPLIQTMLALQPAVPGARRAGGLKVDRIASPSVVAKFDLTLELREGADSLDGYLEYDTDLFEQSTAQRLVEHFLALLDAMSAGPLDAVATLPMLAAAERVQMLEDWNDTARPYATDMPIQRLFEQQVEHTPHANALSFDEQRLSYDQLNARANQLAHWLREHGVGPDVPVGVCLERSFELPVALLGVLKAGGAFVALDPELPADRLAYQLDDSGAPLVLSHSQLLARLPHNAARRIVCLDQVHDEVAERSDHNLNCLTRLEHLAYIIYTSGSTGQPKGVLLPHAGLSNHCQWLKEQVRVTPADRMLQLTSISFDASLVELLMPLHCGATIVLLRPGEQRDSAALAGQLLAKGITILQMVPSALRALLAEPGFEPGELRYVISGGEALDLSLAQELQRRLPQVQIGNFYGPTENSIDATHCEWPIEIGASQTVPIGRPIANVQCYVLDGHLQPVPVGVVGELYIGGRGLARGYLNLPELTTQRFVANPFAEGQRLYRSGDMVRYRDDGNIEYRGRTDSQVKLRGYRIELGEIEAALAAQPGVRHCAVLACEESPGLKRLVAYFVGEFIEVAALKRSLAQSLPEYMVPGQFVMLDAMPSLPNGKIDRKALPAPQPFESDVAVIAPRDAHEQAVWDIWRDVLKVERFGVHENFFELGGHSLVAMQAISRMRSRLKVEVSLRTMFNHPSIAELVREIEGASDINAGAAPVPIDRIASVQRDGALPVSFAQRRMWIVQEMNPQSSAYNVRLALRLRGALDVECLRQALAGVVQRHEAFRTRFVVINGEPMQQIDAAHAAEMAYLDLGELPADERDTRARRILSELATRPFDLNRSGLHRLHLLRLAADEHALFWVMHHAICDGWSHEILLHELSQRYGALTQGRPQELPPVSLDYADYATWQRSEEQRAKQESQLPFWRDRLKGLEPLALPYDRPSIHGQLSGLGHSVSARLPAETLDRLKQFSARCGATPFMTLLACFKLLLWRYCGQRDIVVGTPVSNRNRTDLEQMVGPMLNTLVLRTELCADLSFSDLLARVRETALEAFAHQEVPFERLVEEVAVNRAASRSPLFNVFFNVLGARSEAAEFPGLAMSEFDFESEAAQFDLSLTCEPDASGAVHLGYSTDLFERSSAQRMLTGFTSIVEQTLFSALRPLRDFGAPGLAQCAELARWNDTATAAIAELRVDQVIGQSVARHTAKVALRSESGFLSYSELWSRSHRLARHLRALGISRGTLVGLCVERSLNMVVAQLAILEAGAAYVPLDPAYPVERLAMMASDAQLALLVTESSFEQVLPWPADRRVLLDLDAPAIAALSDGALAPDAALDAGPTDPAYVIYTSGSTGKPKGVVVPHGAVVNFLTSMAREPGLCATDVLVAVTTLSFDIAVLELLAPLTVGAQVVLASRDQATDGRSLRSLLESHGATVLQATPSSWRLLIEAGWSGSPGFKALIGGEPLPLDLAQQLLVRCGDLWNMYGPTETTVWSTCWRVTQPESGISIGRPIANTQVHVLDANGEVCPIGVIGEIYIGGAGVALGYLHRPELTAERFVANPFRPGAKLYRTGDRGRWRHDGLLDHQGRLDHQVKVRGHRIELGEIEATLASHPQVSQAVVIVREDRPGDVRLVAYVIGSGEPAAPSTLREHLRGTLPEYMLPQHYVRLDMMPLLPNGKLDRHALPVPAIEVGRQKTEAEDAPRTPLESAIAGVWQELLGVPQVGPHDNFFDLGGHSLLAMRAVHEIEKRTHIKLTLGRLIFESLGQLSSTEALDAKVSPVAKVPTKDGKFARFVRALADLRQK